MKRKHYIIPLLVALFATAGCEKMIEFDIDEVDPMVVVSSLNDVDSNVYVRLTYSRFFLDNHAFRVIDNANVQLFVNGTAFGTAPVYNTDKERYFFNYKPQPGDSLELHIDVPGHETVTAGTRVPSRANIGTPQIQVMADPNDDEYYYYNTPTIDLRFDLNDPADEKNYYSVSIIDYSDYMYIRYYRNYVGDTIVDTVNNDTFTNTMAMTINDVVINPNTDVTDVTTAIDGGTTYTKFFFTDDNFNGRTHNVPIQFRANSYDVDVNDTFYYDPSSSTIMSVQIEHHHYYLKVVSYNRDAYQYYITSDAARDDLDNIGIFNEPTQVYSNINGGIGILGAKSTSRIQLNIPENPNRSGRKSGKHRGMHR